MILLRQRRKIFAQGNSIMRKFYMCSDDVKLTLFKSYCSSFYTAHLWINYTNTIMNKLYTAYHNVLKMFIGVSKCEHTRPICATLNVKILGLNSDKFHYNKVSSKGTVLVCYIE